MRERETAVRPAWSALHDNEVCGVLRYAHACDVLLVHVVHAQILDRLWPMMLSHMQVEKGDGSCCLLILHRRHHQMLHSPVTLHMHTLLEALLHGMYGDTWAMPQQQQEHVGSSQLALYCCAQPNCMTHQLREFCMRALPRHNKACTHNSNTMLSLPAAQLKQQDRQPAGRTTPTMKAVQPRASSCRSAAGSAPGACSTKSACSPSPPSSVLLEPLLLLRPSCSTPSSMPSCSHHMPACLLRGPVSAAALPFACHRILKQDEAFTCA